MQFGSPLYAWDSANLCFFDKLQAIVAHVNPVIFAFWQKKALWFVYILMHTREEWVLVQLSSQHKRIEWPVQPVFPDYLSVSYDYGDMNWSKVRQSRNANEAYINFLNIIDLKYDDASQQLKSG